jgi:hypothetical protein
MSKQTVPRSMCEQAGGRQPGLISALSMASSYLQQSQHVQNRAAAL